VQKVGWERADDWEKGSFPLKKLPRHIYGAQGREGDAGIGKKNYRVLRSEGFQGVRPGFLKYKIPTRTRGILGREKRVGEKVGCPAPSPSVGSSHQSAGARKREETIGDRCRKTTLGQ